MQVPFRDQKKADPADVVGKISGNETGIFLSVHFIPFKIKTRPARCGPLYVILNHSLACTHVLTVYLGDIHLFSLDSASPYLFGNFLIPR